MDQTLGLYAPLDECGRAAEPLCSISVKPARYGRSKHQAGLLCDQTDLPHPILAVVQFTIKQDSTGSSTPVPAPSTSTARPLADCALRSSKRERHFPSVLPFMKRRGCRRVVLQVRPGARKKAAEARRSARSAGRSCPPAASGRLGVVLLIDRQGRDPCLDPGRRTPPGDRLRGPGPLVAAPVTRRAAAPAPAGATGKWPPEAPAAGRKDRAGTSPGCSRSAASDPDCPRTSLNTFPRRR